MNIGIIGASGFLGQSLIDLAIRRGHQCIGFSRSPDRPIPGCDEVRAFSLETPPDLRACEAIVNLAGESVFGFWSRAKQRRVRESRIEGTRRIVEAINALPEKPEVFLCASGVGFYGDRGDTELREDAPAGEGWFPRLTKDWEAESHRADGVRVVNLRTAVVLSRKGGAFPLIRRLFSLGLGGRLGSGRQWFPWIHIDDWRGLAMFAIENMDIRGPLNFSAPWPVRNSEFTREVARRLRRPAILPAPAFALRIALGNFSAELLDSHRAVPAAATEHGFGFKYPELPAALAEIIPA